MNPPIPSPRHAAAALALLWLSGCASFSPDGGFDQVAELTRARTGQAPVWQRTPDAGGPAEARTRELLQQPLTADAAVELAFLNNRGLQASFAELGIAESDLVRAGRLANPRIGFGHVEGGGVTEIDRSVIVDVLGLLTMPLARQIEQHRFEQAQYQAAANAVELAGATRKAFFAAVAAQQIVTYGEQVKDAADASGELARRMLQAGNLSALAQLRQQSFAADAKAQLARAQHAALAERERLARRIGLSADAFTLIERLPDLPVEPAEPQHAEQTAMAQRLDVQLARRATEATARSLGLTKATRFVNVLEAGYANKSQTGEARRDGYQIELELPLFDFGSARMARAEALYLQSLHRTAELANNARSEVRERTAAYRTAYALARHYRDDVVPLQRRISDENLLRYNGMLLGPFELLADARAQAASVVAAIEALREHWMAQTDLQLALTGRVPEPGAVPVSSVGSAAPGDAAAH